MAILYHSAYGTGMGVEQEFWFEGMGPNKIKLGSLSKTQKKKILEDTDRLAKMLVDLKAGASVKEVTSKYRWINPRGFDSIMRIFDRHGGGTEACDYLSKYVAEMRKAMEELKVTAVGS